MLQEEKTSMTSMISTLINLVLNFFLEKVQKKSKLKNQAEENKKTLLYEKKLKAIERIKYNINILSTESVSPQFGILLLKYEKIIDAWDEASGKEKEMFRSEFKNIKAYGTQPIQVMIANIKYRLKDGLKEHEIEQYVSKELWKAYKSCSGNIGSILDFIKNPEPKELYTMSFCLETIVSSMTNVEIKRLKEKKLSFKIPIYFHIIEQHLFKKIEEEMKLI